MYNSIYFQVDVLLVNNSRRVRLDILLQDVSPSPKQRSFFRPLLSFSQVKAENVKIKFHNTIDRPHILNQDG